MGDYRQPVSSKRAQSIADVRRCGAADTAHAAGSRTAKLAGGHWTHDYALTATEAAGLGLPVKVGIPAEVMDLMKLYPQPIQQSGVEFLPIDIPHRRRV